MTLILVLLSLLLLKNRVLSECHFAQPHRLDCVGLNDLNHLNSTFNLDPALLPGIQTFTLKCNEDDLENTTLSFQRYNLSTLEDVHIRKCNWEIIKKMPAMLNYKRLEMFNLSGNGIQEFKWQDAKWLAKNSRVDLRDNPLKCSCENRWVLDQQHQPSESHWTEAQILELPLKVLVDSSAKNCLDKSKTKCENELTIVRPEIINTSSGAEIQVQCTLGADVPNFEHLDDKEKSSIAKDAFFWLLDLEKPHEDRQSRVEVWLDGPKSVGLKAKNLTSDELGMLVCRCLHCVGPSFGTAELRFKTALSATLHEHLKEVQLAVHGFPLTNLTMSVTKLPENKTEKHELGQDLTVFFNGTFVSKFEADHSFDFLQYYHIYVKECVLCPRSVEVKASDYVIQICSQSNCASVQSRFGHHRGPVPMVKPKPEGGNHRTVQTVLFASMILLTILIVYLFTQRKGFKKNLPKLASVTWRKNNRIRRPSRHTMNTEETSLREDSISASFSNYSLQHVPIIPKEQLVVENKIGKGAFGDVFSGEWLAKNTKVAVKMLHNVHVDAQMDKEAAMLAELDHENVVKMFGVCKASASNLYLVLELMNQGDLKTYVYDRKPKCDNYSQFPPALLNTELIDIARQVCTGLAYISSQQIVHRDLAARNCLVSGDSDVRVCSAAFRPPITIKISDFGMSRRIYSHSEYYKLTDQKTALPVRWLPPECMNSGKFTTQSDIWAFGVTLYEVFSFGDMPYGDLSNNEALVAVISGVRPDIPAKTPEPIARIMKDCWKAAPDERPVAEEVLIRLKELQQV